MEPTQTATIRPLGRAEVLQAIQTWPSEEVLALTRELVGALPPEERAAVGREALATPAPEVPRKLPTKEDDEALIGMISWPEEWGEPDVKKLREERLSEKYAPWRACCSTRISLVM